MTVSGLPEDGELRLGPLTLPAGKRIKGAHGSGDPVAWVTLQPVPDPGKVWAALSAARRETGASHALAVLIEIDDGPDRIDFGGSIYLAIAAEEGVESRRSRIYGGRDWVRLGAVELGLDCLRRYLQGLPVTERTDFERV